MKYGNKQMALNKSHSTKKSFKNPNIIKFSPSQQQYAIQNGNHIIQFLRQKKLILDKVELCSKSDYIIDICQQDNFKTKIKAVKHEVMNLSKEVIQKRFLKYIEYNNKELQSLNKSIYQQLIQIKRCQSSISSSLSKLLQKNMQIKQQQDNLDTIFQLQKFTSPQMTKNTANIQDSTQEITRLRSKDYHNHGFSFNQSSHQIKAFQQYILNQQTISYQNVKAVISQKIPNYMVTSQCNAHQLVLNQCDPHQVLTSQQNFNTKYISSKSHSLDQRQYFLQRNNNSTNYNYNATDISVNQYEQFYLSFIISCAAQRPQYKHFINQLLDQVTFQTQTINSNNQSQIEQSLRADTDYSLEILTRILKNNFDRMQINADNDIKTQNCVYLSNNKQFLKMTLQFIKQNLAQLTSKIIKFIEKALKINQIYTQINGLNLDKDDGQIKQNLTNTLSSYLEQNKDLVSMKKQQIQPIQKIVKSINQAKYFQEIKEIFFSSLKYYISLQEGQQKRQQISDNHLNFVISRKAFFGWKKIKARKMKILKLLLKKHIKRTQKQKVIIFCQWRINISRQKIQDKMLAHSHSCTNVINKFVQLQIQNAQIKKTKTKQIYDYNNMKLKQSSISINRDKSMKDFRKSHHTGSSLSRYQNASVINSKHQFKVLNHQYKKSRINKMQQQKSLKYKSQLQRNTKKKEAEGLDNRQLQKIKNKANQYKH